MAAARVGKDGYVRQIAGYNSGEGGARARYVPWATFLRFFFGAQAKTGTPKKRSPLQELECPCVVCVYHVGQNNISKLPGICGEALACFQVDVIAGDGNKACYLATPKAGGCPTYGVSLLQCWINRMIHTVAKARLKSCWKAPAVRVKHFISCSYKGLAFLTKHLRGISTNTCTHELAKKTENAGDCCMMSICEWGYARLEFEEDINEFDDQDHMDFVGKFSFSVNETRLSCDYYIFIVAPMDIDSHNPLLVHLDPSDMNWKERHSYVPPHKKIERKERRKDKQKSNKRKGQNFGDAPLLDPSWDNLDGRGEWTQGSSSSTAWVWRPKNRCVYTLTGEDNTR